MTALPSEQGAKTAARVSLSAPTLTVLLAATFLTAFDFFVVNVAAVSIQRDIRATPGELELVVGGYAFSYAGALILGGRLGDLIGHRKVFGAAMVGFVTTSAVCGLAEGPAQLILARLAQGLAAAVMMPQVLAIISRNCTPAERARAMAWYGVAGGVGSVSAQVFGGLLVTVDVAGLGWRLIFLINVPVGILAAYASTRVLPADAARSGPTRRQLDVLGALGIAAAMGLLLVPITLGRSVGWPAWTWVSILTAPAVFGLTLAWQRSFEQRGGHPLIDLALARVRSFRVGLLASFAFMAFFASYMFTLALLLQNGLGLDAFRAGLVFAPAGIAFSVSATLAPRLVARFPTIALTGGALLTAAGLIALAVLADRGGAHTSPLALTAVAAVISLGNGIVMPSLISAALHDVPVGQAGVAAGALTTAQQFASAAGVAVVGTIYFARTQSGPGAAMAWAALADTLLILVVAATIVANAKGSSTPPSAAERP